MLLRESHEGFLKTFERKLPKNSETFKTKRKVFAFLALAERWQIACKKKCWTAFIYTKAMSDWRAAILHNGKLWYTENAATMKRIFNRVNYFI